MKNKTIERTQQDDPANTQNTTPREAISLTVNPPFRNRQYVANKQLTEAELEKLEKSVYSPEE